MALALREASFIFLFSVENLPLIFIDQWGKYVNK